MMPSLPRRLAPRALPRLWYSVQVEIVSGRDSSTRGGRWPSRSRRCGCCSAPQCRPHSLSQKACSRGSATQQVLELSSKAAGGGARSTPYLTPPKVRTQRLLRQSRPERFALCRDGRRGGSRRGGGSAARRARRPWRRPRDACPRPAGGAAARQPGGRRWMDALHTYWIDRRLRPRDQGSHPAKRASHVGSRQPGCGVGRD